MKKGFVSFACGLVIGGIFIQPYGNFGKAEAQPVEDWVARYNGPSNFLDLSHDIAVDASRNVYVTGESDGNCGSNDDFDYLTLKYSKPGTGIMEEGRSLFPTSVFLVYPNPFESIANLQGKGDYKIYDITGRLRDNVTEGFFGENLESGVYFIRQGERAIKVIKIR